MRMSAKENQHAAKLATTHCQESRHLVDAFFPALLRHCRFKTISVEAIAFAGIDSEFVCNADCMKVANVIIYKERFDFL